MASVHAAFDLGSWMVLAFADRTDDPANGALTLTIVNPSLAAFSVQITSANKPPRFDGVKHGGATFIRAVLDCLQSAAIVQRDSNRNAGADPSSSPTAGSATLHGYVVKVVIDFARDDPSAYTIKINRVLAGSTEIAHLVLPDTKLTQLRAGAAQTATWELMRTQSEQAERFRVEAVASETRAKDSDVLAHTHLAALEDAGRQLTLVESGLVQAARLVINNKKAAIAQLQATCEGLKMEVRRLEGDLSARDRELRSMQARAISANLLGQPLSSSSSSSSAAAATGAAPARDAGIAGVQWHDERKKSDDVDNDGKSTDDGGMEEEEDDDEEGQEYEGDEAEEGAELEDIDGDVAMATEGHHGGKGASSLISSAAHHGTQPATAQELTHHRAYASQRRPSPTGSLPLASQGGYSGVQSGKAAAAASMTATAAARAVAGSHGAPAAATAPTGRARAGASSRTAAAADFMKHDLV